MTSFTFKVVDTPNPFTQVLLAVEALKPSQRIEIEVPTKREFETVRTTLLQRARGTITTSRISDTAFHVALRAERNGATPRRARGSKKKTG